MNGRTVIPAPARADVKERPILFSAPMVRALLDDAKTQTRRIFKPERIRITEVAGWLQYSTHNRDGSMTGGGQFIPDGWLHYCPYGQPGSRLWVRETWAIASKATDLVKVYYAASERQGHTEFHEYFPVSLAGQMPATWPKYRPSIHMPRWASRILLEIVSVRVERLQAITLGDICKEGLATSIYDFQPATDGFRVWAELWESINGAGSWAANPWCWAIEFRRVAP